MSKREGILERLSAGILIGDGGMLIGLERRGYTRAGAYNPECVILHPEAVRQYHQEFVRAGSDVVQAMTFFAYEKDLERIDKSCGLKAKCTADDLNNAAIRLAREVAGQHDCLVSGSLTTARYLTEADDKVNTQNTFREQVKCFVKNNLDFIICEYINDIEEMEWAIEVAKESGLPVAATLCIDKIGDVNDVPTGECAIRMVQAGADLVGVNCIHNPMNSLETMKVMKDALEKANLKPYLICQPYGFHTIDIKRKQSPVLLTENPYAMEPRLVTRFEWADFARKAYDMGVRYTGGCCGTEPYHIRAISEELHKERGKICKITEENGFLLDSLVGNPAFNERLTPEYWKTIQPSSGRS